MDLLLLVKGILIGVLMSFPFGAMGMLCIQRTINSGRVSGFLSGMGVAAGDTIYAVIAGFGASFIVHFIEERQFVFQILGSAIIILLGINVFLSNPVKKFRFRRNEEKKYKWHFFSSFLLALTNPFILFAFVAVFTTLNLFDRDSFMPALTIILGIFAGATASWFLLSSVVNHFRAKFRLRRIYWLNKIAGFVIFIFGFVAAINIIIAG